MTAKECRISDVSRKHINDYLAKVTKLLSNFAGDLVVLRLTIRKNIDRYHPPKIKTRKRKNYSDLKSALSNFEGSINFRLLKNSFHTNFKGKTIDECLNLGFMCLFKKLRKFKDLHFPAASEYPHRESIRGGVFNE